MKMKQISTFAGWIALIAVAILYFLFFSQPGLKRTSSGSGAAISDTAHFRIAYFNIDTLQEYYLEFKDAEEKMKAKESTSKNTLSAMSAHYQKRLAEIQAKAKSNTLTEIEGQAAQQELGRLENEYRQKDMELDQELKLMQMELMNALNKKVEAYLKEFNKDKGYAYVFSYQPGMLMYYKDSIYDVTGEMIKGLNQAYKKNGN
jgi:outer membrane protein